MPRTEGAPPGADEQAIQALINKWMVYRDAGEWDRLRPIWHEDGRMAASWRQGTADEFIASNRANWDKGLSIFHELGAVAIEVRGARALSQTKMTITQRAALDGVVCDVTAMARHLDRWEKRDGLWGLVLRETLFDRDRLDSVVPGQAPALDRALLESFPEPYRHLGYLQTKLGFEISRDIPRLRSPAGDALIAEGRRWLEG
ncbi:MAG TPA: nuclear transport factor 2 family protein [Caulobacteraceae bacterium]|jgi:hypothetical protein|nr:nuclear transport factor 2 family protein [Caulobacteraceae bacterium]